MIEISQKEIENRITMKIAKILFTLAAFSILSPLHCMHLYHTREMTKTAAQRAADATEELQNLNFGIVSYSRAHYAQKIKDLVLQGANPDTPDFQGYYPLVFAAGEQWANTVNFLLQHNANPNIQNNLTGSTALIEAVDYGPEDSPIQIVDSLLTWGANPNIQDRVGNTALIVATRGNKPRIVRILLENRADYRIANNAGETPLAIARNNNYQAIIKILNEFERKKLE